MSYVNSQIWLSASIKLWWSNSWNLKKSLKSLRGKSIFSAIKMVQCTGRYGYQAFSDHFSHCDSKHLKSSLLLRSRDSSTIRKNVSRVLKFRHYLVLPIMQILQDTKSSTPIQSDSNPSDILRQKGSSHNPDREAMCLVFSDGTVRTVYPKPQSS